MRNCFFLFTFFYTSSLLAKPITLEQLKQQITLLQQQIKQLESQQNRIEQRQSLQLQDVEENTQTSAAPRAKNDKSTVKNSFRAYATVRPTFGYIQENAQKQTDVRDALSHAGFKASRHIKPGWTAEVQGEWSIDLSNNGDFGKTRRVYVALDSPYGRLGIGKQRPPQYLFVAEYIDIFNHGASPFSYDPESIFFVNNMLTYKYHNADLTWMAAARFDGAAGDNHNDLFNAGVSYDKDKLHMAVTYLSEDNVENGFTLGKDNVWAGSVAYTFANELYLAVGYQDRDYKLDFGGDRSGHTFDISGAYPLTDGYKLKLGYFDFDDGFNTIGSRSFDGFNTTLEWLPAPGLRFHLEYLYKDFDTLDEFWSWSLGLRYDIDHSWYF